jgi:4-hydroxybenzoate polyprenyltransferase
MTILDLFKLLRVKQWTKNVFVLAAFCFTKGWTSEGLLVKTLFALLAMCLISSATYIANDIFDVAKDRQHPKKKNRPIAAGHIPVSLAWTISGILGIFALGISLAINFDVFLTLVTYLAIQVLYNGGLRNKSIADVFCIASGFVLRVIVGAIAIQAQLSGWILLCTAALALMLGFGKRRHEFHSQGDDRQKSRSSLADYNAMSLDMLVLFSSAFAVMTYSVYSIESQTAKTYPALILTTPFVIYGIARYLVLVFGTGETGEPETLVLSDKHLIAVFWGYAIATGLALSGLQIPILLK